MITTLSIDQAKVHLHRQAARRFYIPSIYIICHFVIVSLFKYINLNFQEFWLFLNGATYDLSRSAFSLACYDISTHIKLLLSLSKINSQLATVTVNNE